MRGELVHRGFAVCRQVLPPASVERARRHLEAAVGKHLAKAMASDAISDACEGLPLEDRLASAYAAQPERAPVSWVPEVRHSLAFQGMMFRDPALCELVEALTGRPAQVGDRFNCRSKLRGASEVNFPWHQDHAFFRMQALLKKARARRLLAAWAPLVPVSSANGGVELAARSHAAGLVRHRRQGAFLAAESEPPVGLERAVPALEAGDVLLFTDLTLHRSGPNGLPTVRWSADWAYELEPDDVICPALEPPGLPREPNSSCARTSAAAGEDGAHDGGRDVPLPPT